MSDPEIGVDLAGSGRLEFGVVNWVWDLGLPLNFL